MITKEIVIKEMDSLPEPLLNKVYEYIRRLKKSHKDEKKELLHLAETSFSKDWMDKEEDERWSML